MTDRKNNLPPEHQGLKPEEFVDVYELPDGTLAFTTREGIAQQVEGGRYDLAFHLMRYQLMRAAQAALRKAGCSWRRADALWWSDDHAPPATEIAAMIEDASEFVHGLGVTDPAALAALETLQHLGWQSKAIEAAATEAEREALRRMALASASLGFLAAHSGIEGVVPSLREVSAIAERAQEEKRRKSEAAHQTAAKRRDAWHPRAKEIARAELARWPKKSDDALATAIALEAGKGGFSPPGHRQIARAVAGWRGAPDGIPARPGR